MTQTASAFNQPTQSIEILGSDAIEWREQNGLLVPMHEGAGIQVIGCGDERSWTNMFARIVSQIDFENGPIDIEHFNAVYQSTKVDPDCEPDSIISPARCMGGVNGLAMDMMLFMLLDKGRDGLKELFKKEGPYTIKDIVGLCAEISTKANKLDDGPVLACHHSSDRNEGNGGKLSLRNCCSDAIGCAFAHNFSNILSIVAKNKTTLHKSRRISDLTNDKLDLDTTTEVSSELISLLDGDISVNRKIIRHYQRNGSFVPVEMHTRDHFSNTASAMVIDNVGYRSNAGLNISKLMPRYHHSLMLSHYILSRIFPEFVKEDSQDKFKAISLMAAMATHGALSDMNKGNLRIEVATRSSELARAG